MIWFKCCPHCNGDLNENRDEYGSYTSCIQCGYYLTEAEEVLLKYSFREPSEVEGQGFLPEEGRALLSRALSGE
jgi:hypothetical protein